MYLKKYLFIVFFIVLLISACKRTKNEDEAKQEETVSLEEIKLPATDFDDNWDKIYESANAVSQAEYDSLGLDHLTFLQYYNPKDLSFGTIFIKEENRKLFTVKTAGESAGASEISEYLLSYVDNKIADSLLIAYEDYVEYLSATSSFIKGDTITVTVINWNYEDMNNVVDKGDTLITQYIITPRLKFEEIIEK